MTLARRATGLVLALCVLFSGCYIRLGYREKVIRTEEQKAPGAGRIESEARLTTPPGVTLRFTRVGEGEVKTVEMVQRVTRRLELTGLVLGLAIPSGILLLVLFIAALSHDGDGGGGSSWDFDDWD